MASNVLSPVTEDSSSAGNQSKPKRFEEIVAEYADKLPVAVEVTSGGRYSGTKDGENNNIQLHKGDIVWVTKANVETVTASTESHQRKKENTAVTIPPDWSGTFQLPITEEYPSGHTYTSVAQLANDFPIFVTVRDEFQIDKVTVKEGNRLKLVRQTTTATGDKVLLCDVVETGDNVLLPEDMEGKFEKTENNITFKVKDLSERLPLHVQATTSKDKDGEDGKADRQRIPGIPDDYDGNVLLNVSSYTEGMLWETSNQEGGSIVKIPSGTKMEAVVLENWEEDKSPAIDIMELAKVAKKDKPVYAMPAEGSGEILDELGVAHDATLILHPIETVERVLVQGSNSPLLVNKNYKGYFKPQTEYGTGYDLVNFGIHREVKVTQPYQPKDDENGLATLHVNDMVKLQLSKAKMFSTDEDTEVMVVELERTASKSGAKLGDIFVPASAMVGYQEKVQYTVDQKLTHLAQSQVPISASFSSPPVTKTPTVDSTGIDEELLQQESPMMILGLYKYPVVMATVLKQESPKDSKTIEISEHRQLKVRRVRRPLPSSLTDKVQPDNTDSAAVKKVTQKYFDIMNQTFQQHNAAKNVKRRKKKTGNKDNENKRKSWVQRNISFKAIQKRLSKTPEDHTGQNGQKTEEWTI